MKGIVAELKGKYAVVLTQDGLFKKVRALHGMTVGMEMELGRLSGNTGSRRFAARVASMAAAGLLVLGIGFGAYSYTVPYSYVDIDINPSIELTVNIYDRIIGAEALNEDGGKLLVDRELRHKKLDNGVAELLNSAVEQGYLKAGTENADSTGASGGEGQPAGNGGQAPGSGSQSSSGNGSQSSGDVVQTPGNASLPSEGGEDPAEANAAHGDGSGTQGDTAESGKGPVIENAVMVTVSSNNSKKSVELKKKIAGTASMKLDKDKVNSEILVGEASNEQREAARKLGVTPGKLALIEDALKHLPEKELDDVKNTAVKELIEIARKNTKAVPANKETPGKEGGSFENSGKGGNNSSNKGNDNNNSNKSNYNDSKSNDPGNSRNNVNNDESTVNGKEGRNAAANKYNKDDGKGGNQITQNNNSGNSSKDNNKDNGKSGSSKNDKNADQREKKNDISVKEALQKSGEELRRERERLKDEFLRQIENSRYRSGEGNARQDSNKPAGEDRMDKKDKNDKNDKKQDLSSRKKGGTGNGSKGGFGK